MLLTFNSRLAKKKRTFLLLAIQKDISDFAFLFDYWILIFFLNFLPSPARPTKYP